MPYRTYRSGKNPSGEPKSQKRQLQPTAARPVDWHTCKERHLIECFFNRIKPYRRIFSRFDKLASRYLGFLNFVAALVWLR